METDSEFFEAFQNGSLAFERWTHAAHIRMAHLVCKSSKNFDEALEKIRVGIQHFNGIHASKLKVGFHETMTHLWTTLVWNATRSSPSTENAAQFIEQNSSLLDSSLWKQYYSPGLMFSAEAKAHVLQPDMKSVTVNA